MVGTAKRPLKALQGRGKRPKLAQKKEDHDEVERRGNELGEDVGMLDRKVKALQSLVPGGESLEIESLFEETAEYIQALQGQVYAMKALVSFFDALERDKRKIGG
ncbi:hypothetical protein QJS04_geneDACA020230 [Acorus gramineus]|uniref:Uncharacterized protein n=1 Tax=Acorus gramineus TaxID=55184 RepID=A0AAV9A4E7_ACOGR|nr:hypothetical protein QJS04_geneDACA020230 [Acorus gramineus]